MLVQRRRFTGQLVVIATTLGTSIYGGSVGISGLRHGNWIRAVGGTTVLTIGAIFSAVLLIRGWLVRHSASMRSDLETLATERRAVEDTARLVERQTATNQLRIESIQKRLDDTLDELSRERGQRIAVQRELRELTEEHNLLIQETLQAGADRFVRRSKARGDTQTPTRQRARIPNTAARGDHDRV